MNDTQDLQSMVKSMYADGAADLDDKVQSLVSKFTKIISKRVEQGQTWAKMRCKRRHVEALRREMRHLGYKVSINDGEGIFVSGYALYVWGWSDERPEEFHCKWEMD